MSIAKKILLMAVIGGGMILSAFLLSKASWVQERSAQLAAACAGLVGAIYNLIYTYLKKYNNLTLDRLSNLAWYIVIAASVFELAGKLA